MNGETSMHVHLRYVAMGALAATCTMVLITVLRTERAPGSDRSTLPMDASAHAARLLGQRLPALTLTDAHGNNRDVLADANGEFALLMLLREQDCVTCVDFPLEARVVRNGYRSIHPVLVGISEEPAFFATYFRNMRMTEFARIDTAGRMSQALGTDHTPLALLVSPERRIILVDIRSGAESSTEPISRILSSLFALATTAYQ